MSSSLWETRSSLPFLSFTARVESLGLALRESPAFNFAEGVGLDVDIVKLLLLAQQKQRVQAALGGRFQGHTLSLPSSSGSRLGIAPIAAAKRDGAGGTRLSPCLVGWGESACLWIATKGGKCSNCRKAAVRCLCGLFKQLEDPPSNQRKSCHRHPQQAIKSDFPFQGSLVPLLGFSPLCKHTHTSGGEG